MAGETAARDDAPPDDVPPENVPPGGVGGQQDRDAVRGVGKSPAGAPPADGGPRGRAALDVVRSHLQTSRDPYKILAQVPGVFFVCAETRLHVFDRLRRVLEQGGATLAFFEGNDAWAPAMRQAFAAGHTVHFGVSGCPDVCRPSLSAAASVVFEKSWRIVKAAPETALMLWATNVAARVGCSLHDAPPEARRSSASNALHCCATTSRAESTPLLSRVSSSCSPCCRRRRRRTWLFSAARTSTPARPLR